MARRRQQDRKRARKEASRPREGAGPLPSLLGMSDLPGFDELASTDAQRAAFDAAVAEASAAGVAPEELSMGCVVRLDRGFPAIACADGTFRAEFSAQLAKDKSARAAVGDWVAVRRPQAHDMGVVEKILPRESDIARWRGGNRGERQTLAANVDVVLVAQAVSDRGVELDRIVRSVVIAMDCGASAAVVLTKADRAASASALAADVALLRDVLGEGVPVVVTCAGAADGDRVSREGLRDAVSSAGVGWGEGAVRSLVPEGTVAIVLGESGAGKSTLLNALLGREILETGAVRESDDAGRHTTVARRMVSLPGAGVIVDEPGLRSLPLVGHERGLAKAFPLIADAARDCRFRDCTHTHEPGCEVRARVGEGYDEAQLEAYVTLAAEMRAAALTLDPDVVL